MMSMMTLTPRCMTNMAVMALDAYLPVSRLDPETIQIDVIMIATITKAFTTITLPL